MRYSGIIWAPCPYQCWCTLIWHLLWTERHSLGAPSLGGASSTHSSSWKTKAGLGQLAVAACWPKLLAVVLLKKGIKKGIKHTLLQVQTNILNTLQCSTHAHKLWAKGICWVYWSSNWTILAIEQSQHCHSHDGLVYFWSQKYRLYFYPFKRDQNLPGTNLLFLRRNRVGHHSGLRSLARYNIDTARQLLSSESELWLLLRWRWHPGCHHHVVMHMIDAVATASLSSCVRRQLPWQPRLVSALSHQ